MRKYLLSIMALVMLVPLFALAADVRNAEIVAKTETPKNLYVGGQNPTVDANVSKDLVIAGGTVTVNGNVENDVLAAGGTLNLNGKVGDSVRVAGGTINIDNEIGGDVVVFGGDITLGTKSVVTGDVMVFGGTVTLKGKVLGSVKTGYAGDMNVLGNVAGDVNLNIGTLTVGSTAVIGGNLKYSAQNEGTISSDAKVGGKVEFTKAATTTRTQESWGSRFGGILFGLVMAFVTLLVFINVLPKFAGNVVNNALINPFAKMGIGFLAMVVTPITLFLLLLTFIGWGVMGYLFLAYIVFFALTGSLTALFAGSYAWKYLKKEDKLRVNWQTAAIGVVIVAALKMIPIVGWLGAFVLALLVFGTLTQTAFEYIKAQRA